MKMLLLFWILLDVSQHALSGVVEVQEGADSVLLPCQYSGTVPEEPIITWTNNEVSPKSVHQRRDEDDLRDQHENFRGRTSMTPDALDSRDFSLTLRKPRPSDQGTYICSISNARETKTLTVIQLKVKDDELEVKVKEGADSVILPCRTSPNLPDDTKVVWTRSEPEPLAVHVQFNTSQPGTKQDDLYCGRTEMNADLLKTGDLSLMLKFPTDRDGGSYICTVYRDEDILRQRVVLEYVKEKFSSLDKVLVVVLVLLIVVLFACGGLFYYFRHYILSVYSVTVNSGAQFVVLPCKTRAHLPEDVKVDWRNSTNMKVHVYLNGSDRSEEQHITYRKRTEINEDPLKTRDLSLRLEHPLDEDKNTYTCIVCNSEGYILLKKDVKLHIRVPEVKVESGVDSVLLPCRTTVQLPADAKVEWRDKFNWNVHVNKKISDQDEDIHWFYKGRTRMNKDLLSTGDLSLTLTHPTDGDTNIYTCSVSSREGRILLKKQVKLHVKVPQVEVESGAESVLLPCRTRVQLPGDAKVEWKDGNNKKVHVYQNGSDQPEQQNRSYRTRTRMHEDLQTTGDLSLTLRWPTDVDSSIYTCIVSSREGDILIQKQVKLGVKVCQVEVESGAESVLLPFRTTPELLRDTTVMWARIDPEPKMMVHVYSNGSDQPEDQDECFSNRTRMNDDLLRTGDLSLTLIRPTETDSGEYESWIESGQIWRKKKVLLNVKGTVRVQERTEDIRNRRESVDPSPLMPEQSV